MTLHVVHKNITIEFQAFNNNQTWFTTLDVTTQIVLSGHGLYVTCIFAIDFGGMNQETTETDTGTVATRGFTKRSASSRIGGGASRCSSKRSSTG